MTGADNHREDLLAENEKLRLRLEEAEDMLRAIGSGEVDAFVVSGADGEQVFTLKGAEQPYRVLVETMNEGAAILATDGTILYSNQRLASLLRIPLEQIVGAPLISHVAPADRPLFAARLGKCTAACDKDEMRMTTGAGTSLPVLISCCALELSGDHGVSVVVTDLTQQKHNEEILASERLANAIIEQAGEAILVCDEDGRIIKANRVALRLCGENPLLERFDELLRLRMMDAECLFSVITPLSGGSFESVEVELNRSDGQKFHLLLNATPLKGDEGRIRGCVVTLTDFTERKQAEELLRRSEESLQVANEELQAQSEELQSQSEELQWQGEELRRMNEELECRVAERTAALTANVEKLKAETSERLKTVEALREKDQLLIQQGRQAAMGEMIGNIAHQWRQPLNTLGLTVQELEIVYDLGELDREFLTASVDSAMELIQHMSQTIDDFRNYFSPEKEKTDFSVSEVITSTLSLIKDSFMTEKIRIEVAIEDDPVIFGFRNEFAQVLLNILNNARDALIERRPEAPMVTITASRHDGHDVVTVSDNAGGIAEEIINKVFDPYFTTKGPRQGTGVGLFMSKTIIEKNMGGVISVRNTAEGAEFRIEVPHAG